MPTKSSNSNSAGIASPAPVLSASSRRQIRHFPLTLYSTFTVPIGIVTPRLLPPPALLPTFDAIMIPIASSRIPSNSFRTLTPFRLLSFRSRVSSIISGRAGLDKRGVFFVLGVARGVIRQYSHHGTPVGYGIPIQAPARHAVKASPHRGDFARRLPAQ